jgi:SAM-dependent methyltransferase
VISLVTWARNEAGYLPRMLESFAGLYDEAVLLDTGSADGTQDIARSLGMEVFEYRDPERRCDCHPVMDFARMQNEAVTHARGDVAIALDSDLIVRYDAEASSEGVRAALEATAQLPERAGCMFAPVLHHFPDFEPSSEPIPGFEGSRFMVSFRPVLDGAFEGRVHSGVPGSWEGSGGRMLPITLHHHAWRGDRGGPGHHEGDGHYYYIALEEYDGPGRELEWNILHWPPDEEIYGSPYQAARVATLVHLAEGRTLEAGCGTGYIAAALKTAGREVVGLDASRIAVERTRARGIEAVHGWAEQMPFEAGSFDTVLLPEILEHVADPGRVMSEACRVARSLVVFSLPTAPGHDLDPMHEWAVRAWSLDLAQARPVTEFNIVSLRRKEA